MNVYDCKPYTLRSALRDIGATSLKAARRIWGDYRDQRYCRRQRLKAARHLARCVKSRPLPKPIRTARSPGYDELRSPVFLGVMALALAVLLIDINEAWGDVGAWLSANSGFPLIAEVFAAAR